MNQQGQIMMVIFGAVKKTLNGFGMRQLTKMKPNLTNGNQ
jgi:hypothetical protein